MELFNFEEILLSSILPLANVPVWLTNPLNFAAIRNSCFNKSKLFNNASVTGLLLK